MKAIVLGLVLVVAVGAADDDKTQAVLRQIMKGQLDVIKHCVGLRGYPYRGIQYPHAPQRHAPVIFHVRSKNDLKNLPANQKVIFDMVDVNEGGGYKVSDGTFTAPKSGFYVFGWTTTTAPEKYFTTDLMVDGHVKGTNYNVATKKVSASGSQMVIVYMTQYEKAWLRIHGNHGLLMHGGYWSSFSGYRLQF